MVESKIKEGKGKGKKGKIQEVEGRNKVTRRHFFGKNSNSFSRSGGINNEDIFQKSFRCFTKFPNINIFFVIPSGDKKDVVYLGKTIPQSAFNEKSEKSFCIVAQNKGGAVVSKDPPFVFDISAYSKSADFMFLDENFNIIHPVDCIEILAYGKWADKEEKYICEKHMYAVSFKVDGSFKHPTIEEWTVEKDKRFVNGAVLLQIKSLPIEDENYLKVLQVVTTPSIK